MHQAPQSLKRGRLPQSRKRRSLARPQANSAALDNDAILRRWREVVGIAGSEGWSVFNDGQIQKIDSPDDGSEPLENDMVAIDLAKRFFYLDNEGWITGVRDHLVDALETLDKS